MSEKSFLAARKEIDKRYSDALLRQEERKQEFIDRVPAALPLVRELDGTGRRIAQAVFAGGNVRDAIEQLMHDTEENRRRLRELLSQAGYPQDYLEVRHTCPCCGDSGYVQGKKCSCLKELIARYNAREFSENTEVELKTFSDFSLRYYSDVPSSETGKTPLQVMGEIVEFCRTYALRFQPHSPSILMTGDTGLGKTHLSLAIATVVMSKGFSSMYVSAPELFRKLQNEYYGKGEPGEDINGLLQKTNLVILDDLGAEMENQFNCASLYSIINYRLNTNRPTIISTNLTPRELERRYTDRVASRLLTLYQCLKFVGKDVRQLRLQEK